MGIQYEKLQNPPYLYNKLQFAELTLEMQNEECKIQNECIFYEND